MNNKARRRKTQEKYRRQKLVSSLTWGGIGLVVLSVIGLMVWQGIKPAAGKSIPIMISEPHIATDSDPGLYNSDPPTSGYHFAETLQAGFYETNDYPYPAGYLVHNLEHGYVILWYDCDQLDEAGCSELKIQIRSVMDDLGGVKLIAYPWSLVDVPVAMTSWGRIQKFGTFDAGQAKAFYRANLNKAPEPNAP